MKRREFITLFGGAVVAATSSAHAQQPARSRRIGILETASPALNIRNLDALRRGLRELGYIENQNYILEYRSADGDAGRFPALANELVRLGVDLIVTRGTPAARAAKNATETIPIVMAAVGEPLGVGIVESLARPGGNLTGLSAFVTELAGKRVELVRNCGREPRPRPCFITWGILSSLSNGKRPKRQRRPSALRQFSWM